MQVHNFSSDMMNELKLLAIGSQVKIGEHKGTTATISAISIRAGNYIQYEAYFWNGQTRTEVWLTPAEAEDNDKHVFTAKLSMQ